MTIIRQSWQRMLGPLMPKEAQLGDRVQVVSGPHEGRGGVIIQIRDISVGDFNVPEAYAVIDFQETDVFNETHRDQIVVPVRRLKPVR